MISGVAVEKLASEKSAKIKTRQEPPQTIFSSHLDIFYLSIFAYFKKKGLFQQPPDLLTVTSKPLPARNVANAPRSEAEAFQEHAAKCTAVSVRLSRSDLAAYKFIKRSLRSLASGAATSRALLTLL